MLGAIGAALTLGVRGGGGLLALLILPLYVPILIFGAGAVDAVRSGLAPMPQLSLLAAALIAAAVGAPLATSAAVRIALDMNAMSTTATINWFRFASPASFYPLAGRLAPWFGIAAAILAAAGLWLGLVVAPTDAQQGEAYRIIFIHVPAAWMSMFIYLVMAFWCAISLGFNARLAAMLAQALAPTGALFTAIALWTGALWGKPTWGTYWAWDARMTSELILLFLYFGYIALRNAIDDPRRADRASSRPGAGGRGQCSDHLFLGQVVEHAAPGRERQPHRCAEDGSDHGDGHARHDIRRMVLFHRRRAGARQGDHPRTRTRCPLDQRGRTMTSLNDLVAMGGYGFYVWGSYAVAALLIVVEIITVRGRFKASRRAAGSGGHQR